MNQKINLYKWLSFVVIGGGALATTPIVLTSCSNPKQESKATKLVIDDAENDSIIISSTLNLAGTHQFNCHDDLGGVPTNVSWTINSTNPLITIDQTKGLLSWTNNLDPDNSNSGFTLTCANDNLASATCDVSIVVERTPGDDVCPNSWLKVDENGLVSLKDGVNRNLIHKLVIPNSLDGINVVGVLNNAFDSCVSLTSVTFPNHITFIGGGAFEGCHLLTSITYTTPSSIEDDTYVLVDGNGVVVTTAGTSTITNGFLTQYKYVRPQDPDDNLICAGSLAVGNVKIPDGVTSIGTYGFYLCSSITSVVFPSSSITIDGYAFGSCSSLTSITYTTPSSIGDDTYVLVDGNGAVVTTPGTSTITNGFLTQYKYVRPQDPNDNLICAGSLAVGNVKIPAGVKKIGIYGFCLCSSITSVILPSLIDSVNTGSFAMCSSLTSITYTTPSSIEDDTYVLVDENGVVVTTAGTSTITNGFLTQYKYVKSPVPDDLICAGSLAVGDVKIPASVNNIGTYGFCLCSSITSVVFPSSSITIDDYAFVGCASLTTVHICDSTVISDYAFSDCPALVSITYTNTTPAKIDDDDAYVLINEGQVRMPGGGETVATRAGCLTRYKYVKDNTDQNLLCVGCLAVGNIKFPTTVTSIGNSAFKYCTSITSITLPNSLTSIGSGAFEDCFSLTSITASYASEPIFANDSFANIGSKYGAVQNTDARYSSKEFLDYLKTKGLSASWTAFD